MAVIAKIALAPETVSWHDPITNIYLTLKQPEAEIHDTMDTTNIAHGIIGEVIRVISGEIEIPSIFPEGPQGEPGKNIELRKTDTHIQWRVVGEEKWKNLIAIEDLQVSGGIGSDGTTVVKGERGFGWISGVDNPDVEQGRDGDFYINTTTYEVFEKDDNTWLSFGILKGEKGEIGNGWLFGMLNPLPQHGKNGDLYIQTTSYDIYKKKNGAWEKTGNIKGAKGDNGKNIELQTSETHIQWRVAETESWNNLISLESLKGLKGDKGETGPKGDAGEQGPRGEKGDNGADGREIELRRHETHVQYKYTGEPDTAWRNVIALKYITGPQGANGANGKQIELQKNDTHVQWRYQGEEAWNNLIELSSIKGEQGLKGDKGERGEQGPAGIQGQQGEIGPKGEQGEKGADGREIELRRAETHVQYRYVGEGEDAWKNVIALQYIKGEPGVAGIAGKNIELQKSATHVQWRVSGTETWNNLVPLEDLRGQKGDRGEPADVSQFYTKAEIDDKISEVQAGGSANLANYYNKQQVDQKISEIELTPGPKGEKGDTGLKGDKGERGEQGVKGETGLKGDKGDKGEDGREIELQKTTSHVQWKYARESLWHDLIALSELKGEQGEIGQKGDKGEQGIAGVNGKNIELQKSPTHIQWRVSGTESWNNLILLEDLKGQKGETGEPADVSQFYTKGEVDEKISEVQAGGNANLANYYNKQEVDQKITDIALTPGPKGEQGEPGPKGETGDTGRDGREIELRRHDTHIQYKYKGEGDEAWKNVVALEYIKGDTGERGEIGPKGQQGDTGLQGVAGTDGREIELQKTETHIQWKYAGDGIWNDLIPLSSIKGEKGETGEQGIKGDIGLTGPQGEQGIQGERGEKGETGNGWLFGTADPRPTDGKNGDLYIQTTSYDIFKKKNGTWENAGNIKGAKGDVGLQGPKGDRGEQGPTGLTGAKGEKGDTGERGVTGETGANGTDGREIELQKSETHIQWKYVGEGEWNNLVALADLKGDPVEFLKTATHIQWKRQSEKDWKDLVYLGDLRGMTGSRGPQGIQGPDGKNVELQKTETHIQWRHEGAEEWVNLIELNEIKGQDGIQGVNGKNVELQKTDSHIQWKNSGDGVWNNLIAIADLKGQKGEKGDPGDNGVPGNDGREIELRKSDTHIQYRYVGEGEQSWQNVVALQDIKGAAGEQGLQGVAGVNGKNIELQKSTTHIQWRVTGEGSWNDLVALSDLKGEPGESGGGSSGGTSNITVNGVTPNEHGQITLTAEHLNAVDKVAFQKHVEGEPFLVTPINSHVISEQDNYIIGNQAYIHFKVETSDGSNFTDGFVNIATLPFQCKGGSYVTCCHLPGTIKTIDEMLYPNNTIGTSTFERRSYIYVNGIVTIERGE